MTGPRRARIAVGTNPTNAPRPETSPDAAIEDYLKAIYQHTEWQDSPITPSELASRLGISPASVTGMIKKLAAAGLVEHKPYGPMSLTAEGTALALSVIRRHRLVETWLVKDMRYTWDQVHDEAEILEHSVSDRLLEAIDQRLGNPRRDPHGDPIPDANGFIERTPFILLRDALSDDVGTVLRISDRDPQLLRLLATHAIRPGTVLHIHSCDETVTSVSANESDHRIRLPAPAARSIWISVPERLDKSGPSMERV